MYNLDLSKPGTAVAPAIRSSISPYDAVREWVEEDGGDALLSTLTDDEIADIIIESKGIDVAARPEVLLAIEAYREQSADDASTASDRSRSTRAATAVTVVEPVSCRMRAVVCRSINERAIVEYTGSETDDRNAVLEAILPQIPDDAWTRSEANSWSYIDSLECIDGDEAVAEAGAMRSAHALATRQDGPGQAAGSAPELEQMLTAIDELIAAAMAAAADADPEALSAAAAEADAQLEALREKFAAIPPAGDAAADA